MLQATKIGGGWCKCDGRDVCGTGNQALSSTWLAHKKCTGNAEISEKKELVVFGNQLLYVLLILIKHIPGGSTTGVVSCLRNHWDRFEPCCGEGPSRPHNMSCCITWVLLWGIDIVIMNHLLLKQADDSEGTIITSWRPSNEQQAHVFYKPEVRLRPTRQSNHRSDSQS